uniref:Ig-like domain-containing protein n=1 Tax=Sander lucioperca TaxID=283035 RepID=A0A8C9WX41_SANLU
SPSDLIMKPGDKVQIFCSHDKPDYRLMYWYQRSPGDTAMKLIGYLYYRDVTKEEPYKEHFNISGDLSGDNASLKIKLVEQEHSAVYYCAARETAEAYFGGGTKLTVLVKVLPPSTKECRNQKDGPRKKTIVCVASGFYPDHVSVKWKIDGIKATSGVATDNAALREGRYYRITSRLKVSGEDWFTLYKNFTCIVEFFDGTATIPYEDTCLVPCLISTKYTGCFLFMSLNWM